MADLPKKNDGLQIIRGIAIFAVVGFHLGIPGFSLGYLGVDAFFVLSGFLIHSRYRAISNWSQTKKYLTRRMLRILPAYAVTSFLTLFVSSFLLLPNEMNRLTKQFWASLFAVNNMQYWLDNQYFDSSTLRPLLHYWSLSVEIQYYLFFPLMIFLSHKIKSIRFGIGIASFLFFVLCSEISSNTAFFLTFSRIWEFEIGALLSALIAKNSYLISLVRALFISCVLVQIVFSSIPTNILACLGTASLISIAIRNEFSLKYLKPLVFLGNISFSLYLVHFPVIVLMNYRPLEGNLTPSSFELKLFEIVLMITIATALRRIVEEPIYIRKNTGQALKFTAGTLLASLLVVIVNPLVSAKIHSTTQLLASRSQDDRTTFRCGVIYRVEILTQLFRRPESCELTSVVTSQRTNKYLLIGNSHADSVKQALAELVEERQGSLRILADNFALSETNLNLVFHVIEKENIDFVILHSSAGQNDLSSVSSLSKFLNVRNKLLIIIGPIPTYEESVPLRVLRFSGVSEANSAGLTGEHFETKYNRENSFYLRLSRKENVTFVNPIPFMCEPKCTIGNDEKLYYYDNQHLTLSGASELILRLSQQPLIPVELGDQK